MTTTKRGLGALIQSTTSGVPGTPATSALTVALTALRPNPNQPRKDFDAEALRELCESIKAKGILQPIIVRPLAPSEALGELKYEIVAGERRWRASQMAGLLQVPIVVKDVSNATEILLLSLIENLQRDDLNPIEEARAYDDLRKNFRLTQEQIADAVGKNRSAVTHSLRLLELPDSVQKAIQDGALSVGHAKVLVGIGDPRVQSQLASKAIAEGITVRQLEEFAAGPSAAADRQRRSFSRVKNLVPPHIEAIEKQLRAHFGTRVKVLEGAKKGKIVIEFYSVDDFDRITGLMGLTD